jgi:hypothetical protein
MATQLDSSIIFQEQMPKGIDFNQSIDSAQKEKLNQQAITMNSLDIQQKQNDLSNNDKLTATLQDLKNRGISTNDPRYTDELQAGLASRGADGKFQLEIAKGSIDREGKQIDNQIKATNQIDNILKLDADKKAAVVSAQEQAIKDMQGLQAIRQAGASDETTYTFLSTHLDDEIKAGVKDPLTGKPMDAQTKDTLMKFAFPDGKTFNQKGFDDHYQNILEVNQGVKDAMASEQAAKDKQAAEIKRLQQEGQDKYQVVPVQGTDENGKATQTYATIDKETGKVVDTGAKVAPKGGAGANATPTKRGLEVQAQMALLGVPVPQGVTGIGASGKAQFFNTLADQYPDKTPTEIAQLAKSGKLDMTASTKEINTAAGKAASTAGAVVSIFGPGGEAESVLSAAKAAGLSDLKGANWTEQQWRKFTSDPKWAGYVSANKELVSSMAQVFSRGGASSVHAQEEAETMFPLNSSIDELQQQLATSRKIAAAVEKGNESVIEAIKAGKPLSEIIAGANSGTGSNSTAPKATASGATVSSW